MSPVLAVLELPVPEILAAGLLVFACLAVAALAVRWKR